MEDLTGAMIESRHAGNGDMVNFHRECTRVLVRDNMSGSGAARTTVVTTPPASGGVFAFNIPAAVSARDNDLALSYARAMSRSPLC